MDKAVAFPDPLHFWRTRVRNSIDLKLTRMFSWLAGLPAWMWCRVATSFLIACRTTMMSYIYRSILGPVLYAIYVPFLFDLQSLINFADYNLCVIWNRDLALLIDDLQKRLEMIVKWLKDSGLVVNESKMEICLFHNNDQPPITVFFLLLEL